MLGSNTNGNTAVFLVVDGKEQPVPEAAPQAPDQPLPRVRQVMVPAETPAAPAKGLPAVQPAPSGPAPTLDEFLNRWRGSKAGLKRATEARLDDCLTMLRRYVDTSRPATDYKPQDIRDYLAKARADKVKGRRRLKGQTINEAIWRPLHNAFALALEEGFINRNPVTFVQKEKTEPIQRNQHKWEDAERNEIKPRLKPGKPLFDWRNPRKAWETACHNLGLAKVDGRSLRRTLIIHLLQKKMEIRLIAEWQGHRDATLILKVYGKYIDADHKKRALAKLGEVAGQN